MSRRIIAGIVSVAAVSLLAGACSSSSKNSGAATGSTPTTAASTGSARGTPSNLPATIHLLSVQDLSGTAGVPGQDAENGMKVAESEINSTHFLGSSNISISFEDDASNPTTSASLFSQAAAGSSPLVFGSVSSANAIVEAPIAVRGGLPTIFTQAGSDGIVTAGQYIFRATPVQSSYVSITGQYMQKQGYKRVAVLVATDVPTLAGLETSFTQMASQYGYSIVDNEQTTSKATDLTAQASKIASAKPDAVVVLALAGQNPTVITQLRQAGFSGPIIGQQGMAGGVLKPLGSGANGIVYATDFTPQENNPGAQHFNQLYKQAYGSDANNFAAEGYDAVWFAARAFKSAGSATRSAVLQGLNTVASQGFSGALGNVKFQDRSEIASGVLVKWENGGEVSVSG